MKRVLLIIPNAFEILECSAFIDVFGWANYYGNHPIELVTAGLSKQINDTFKSIKVEPQILISEVDIEDYDAVAIPGGFETEGFFEEAYSPEILNLLKAFDQQDKNVASICVGALVLGKSGILKGKKATTYHLREGERLKQLAEFGVELSPGAMIVREENKITSSSPSTAIDVALTLLAQLTSQENADHIKKMMGFDDYSTQGPLTNENLR